MATVIRPPEDNDIVDFTVDEWAMAWFCNIGFAPPVPPPPPDVVVIPGFDTFRGGKQIVIFGEPDFLDTSHDTNFLAETLDGAWGVVVDGTGRVIPSFTGLRLSSGTTTSSRAEILSAIVTFDSFDATLTATLPHQWYNLSSASNMLVFEFSDGGHTNYAQVRLRRNEFTVSGQILADSIIVVGGQTRIGGSLLISDNLEFELKIVRHEGHLFLRVNDIDLVSTDKFEPSIRGLFHSFVENNSNGVDVKAVLSSFTMRSHALIDGKLLVNKQDFARQRLVGDAPASTLSRVGFREFTVFGPWGANSDPDGFEYRLPAGLRVGQTASSKLTSYQDVSIRNRGT